MSNNIFKQYIDILDEVYMDEAKTSFAQAWAPHGGTKMYKVNNVDVDKALEAIESAKEYAKNQEIIQQHEISKYYEGFYAGLKVAEKFFRCADYEKEREENA